MKSICIDCKKMKKFTDQEKIEKQKIFLVEFTLVT